MFEKAFKRVCGLYVLLSMSVLIASSCWSCNCYFTSRKKNTKNPHRREIMKAFFECVKDLSSEQLAFEKKSLSMMMQFSHDDIMSKERNFYNVNISGWLQSANFALFHSLVVKKAFDEFQSLKDLKILNVGSTKKIVIVEAVNECKLWERQRQIGFSCQRNFVRNGARRI